MVLKLTKTTAFCVTRIACTFTLGYHYTSTFQWGRNPSHKESSPEKKYFLNGLCKSWSRIKPQIINCSLMKLVSFTAAHHEPKPKFTHLWPFFLPRIKRKKGQGCLSGTWAVKHSTIWEKWFNRRAGMRLTKSMNTHTVNGGRQRSVMGNWHQGWESNRF